MSEPLIDQVDAMADHAADIQGHLVGIQDHVGGMIGKLLGVMKQLEELRKIHTAYVDSDGKKWCVVCTQNREQPFPIGWWVEWPCPTLTVFGITEELSEE
jgi:hypothetical protein